MRHVKDDWTLFCPNEVIDVETKMGLVDMWREERTDNAEFKPFSSSAKVDVVRNPMTPMALQDIKMNVAGTSHSHIALSSIW